jgi:hypothetical protein
VLFSKNASSLLFCSRSPSWVSKHSSISVQSPNLIKDIELTEGNERLAKERFALGVGSPDRTFLDYMQSSSLLSGTTAITDSLRSAILASSWSHVIFPHEKDSRLRPIGDPQ